MAKAQKQFVCQSCGSVTSRWAGKCDACGEWNTIVEEHAEAPPPKGLGKKTKGKALDFVSLQSKKTETYTRYVTRIGEFDRVTGGGLVPGSALLIGGDPGIGKSTLLLQIVCKLAQNNVHCAYISGEEATDQVSMRAQRLGLSDAPLHLAAATNVRSIITSMEQSDQPFSVLIIDSIQTMYVDTIDSAPGTVTQVRTSAQEIIRTAKAKNIAVIFVGHVTKDGQIAGPRVLEHMVDAVLYFEGDRNHHFRILRTVKNRFGPTDEIGVFEMASEGLIEVTNPSEQFLSERHENVAGSAVFANLEGTRPLLVEVQALAAPSSLAAPRRAVLGWDSARLAMILAVLEKRCDVRLSGHDIFLNMAGGIRIQEPAADLAVAAALISAMNGNSLKNDTLFFGEIGLGGEIRQVPRPDLRIKEAAKLGFDEVICPLGRGKNKQKSEAANDAVKITPLARIQDLADLLL